MFGTVICNKNELTEEEKIRYQSTYCGLCRAIKARYGQRERMALNYDMTFLAIMMNALYDEDDRAMDIRCPVHLFKKEKMFSNKYIDYAADMTILLSYYKAKDDWADEAKHSGKFFANRLGKHMAELERKYPRQTACVRDNIEKINKLEKSENALPDEVINSSGKMLSEVFVYKDDYWSKSLRRFGYELGRFIYIMDAALDYERDIKKHTYNPLLVMNKKTADAEPMLIQAIGNAAEEFEKLPILQDEGVIRNILYGGVWQTYNAKIKGEINDKRSV